MLLQCHLKNGFHLQIRLDLFQNQVDMEVLMLKEISLSNLQVGFQLSLNFILLKNSSDLKKKNKNKLVGLLKGN